MSLLQEGTLNDFLHYDGEHICRYPPQEVRDTFYLVSSEKHADHFRGRMTVNVKIKKALAELESSGKEQNIPSDQGSSSAPRVEGSTEHTYNVMIDVSPRQV